MLKGLKGMLFEDSGEEKKSAPASMPASAPAPVAEPVPFVGSEFYERLVQKTDFLSTITGGVIKKYLGALTSVIPDESLRIKTAIAQAKALDGLPDHAIGMAYDELIDTLNKEADQFSAAGQAFVKAEVTERQALIESLTAELKQIQEKIASETVELAQAQAQAVSAETQFRSALTRRTNELAQEKEKFLALSKG